MVRVTIQVDKPSQLTPVYNTLEELADYDNLKIVKV